MKRIQEKIKDLVEVRSYRSLDDFTADPMQTLTAYHFTDITAEMMAKWLDRVSEIEMPSGHAKALAGYRGVGKSHFIGTLGALLANPELRSQITDSYVSASAQRLKRKRYPVGFVRRGTHGTLLSEVRDAVGKTFSKDPATLPETLEGLMQYASSSAGEVPFVLFVDTAFDRSARVSRDDGEPLGELAKLAQGLNLFIGVALDDDIAGADGVNAAIARSYSIDFLDQEHLYRIIEANLFPKFRQTQHLLHEIYTELREVLPNFRWSEQRFTALYPLHPAILETAPFIRLYDKNFAILSFAAEAGKKVLGRPANSLVALDEVFDRVEKSLRSSSDLEAAFETYDKLNSEVVSAIPIMQRLPAKLILKALLVLSLDGDGTTASEISSAMLIYDENSPENSIRNVEEHLERFHLAYPQQVNRLVVEGRETRFGLKISGKDDLNQVLAERAAGVSAISLERILRRFSKERFPDWILQADLDMPAVDMMDCSLSWRGSSRRGRIGWNWERRGGNEVLFNSERTSEFLDWEVVVCHPEQRADALTAELPIPSIVWKPAKLRDDENETIRRYHVLLTDASLRQMFGEQVRAAGHTYHVAVQKIWNRIFIDDAILQLDGQSLAFSVSAKSAQTVSDLFSQTLKNVFDERYPEHPIFVRTLGMSEVSQLVTEHFSGARQTLKEVQELARDFALPLGLVVQQSNMFVLAADEILKSLRPVQTILALVNQETGRTLSLKNVYQKLKLGPFGLNREAQHLILAALVAQRCLEFVTSKGDRITRRSLDLKIIWDDIVGIAEPSKQRYSSEELTKWASILTGIDNFGNIANTEDAQRIIALLETWLKDWRQAELLKRFEALPDEVLNTRVWKLASHAQKTFGSVETTISSLIEKTISLEESLQRVADAFSASEEEFYLCAKNLVVLEDFISGLAQRQAAWNYISLCESTNDAGIEELRRGLIRAIDEVTENPSQALNLELETIWNSFYGRYSEYFASKHDYVMKSHLLQEKFDNITKSDEWWEFENLSNLPIFHEHFWNRAQRLCQKFKELDCGFNVREMVKQHPFCGCSFRLSEIRDWEQLPLRLNEVVREGRASYRQTLMLMSEALVAVLEQMQERNAEPDLLKHVEGLVEILQGKADFRLITNSELIVLSKVVQQMPASPLLQVSFPAESGFQTRDQLRKQFDGWLVQLPSEPCLLKI